jgi:small subunit ribosomal protein S1
VDEQELTPEATEPEENTSPMWELLHGEYDHRELQRGEILTGVVVDMTSEQIVVDVGAKREGIVPQSDLARLGPEVLAEIQIGSEVPVYVVRPEFQNGEAILSINLARSQRDWLRAKELLDSGEILEAPVIGHNKGGLLVEFGQLQGFIPRSHLIRLSGRNENLAQMKGQAIPVKVIEVNRRQRRLILSERAAWREWRRTQKERLVDKLVPGEVHRGKVTSLADFGAFVDLGGADGLIHLSELSWDRNVRPKDVLKEGQEVEVYVLNVDRERRRIGLSLKRLRPDPWSLVEINYQPGDLVEGVITNVTKFGAFARLDEGIEGLIYLSELSDEPVTNPRDVVHEGDRYQLQVLSVDPNRRRIGLSLRRAPPETAGLESEESGDQGTGEPENEEIGESENEGIRDSTISHPVP